MFQVYDDQTAPLITLYAGHGIMYEVDASADIDTVRSRVHQVADRLKQAA